MPLKPSSKEDEYFAREDALKLRKLASRAREETSRQCEQLSEEEKKKLKELHWMHCPKCGIKMRTIEINKIEIDKCFNCGGLYFDDGELEKVTGQESAFFKGINNAFEEC